MKQLIEVSFLLLAFFSNSAKLKISDLENVNTCSMMNRSVQFSVGCVLELRGCCGLKFFFFSRFLVSPLPSQVQVEKKNLLSVAEVA